MHYSAKEEYRIRRIRILCRVMEEFWKEIGILDYANNFKYNRLKNEWRKPQYNISEIEKKLIDLDKYRNKFVA